MDDTGHPQLGSSTADLPEHHRELSVDSARSLLPPRARRADPIDQKLPAPRRSTADAEDVSTPLKAARCQASRVTQEPLEPLAVASPPTCAFCGKLHLSCECDVYLTFTQRLRRAGQLGCCFSCLGQCHYSFACPAKASIKCSLCRHGQHHEALCRVAAPRKSLSMQPAPRRAPTTSAPRAVAPATGCLAPVPATTFNRRTCAFCHSSHWSLKCTVYVSTDQRLRRARQLELCFICLRQGHHAISSPCRAHPCKFCSNGTQHHHRALCRSCAIVQHTKPLPTTRATKLQTSRVSKLPTTRATKLPTNDRADGTQRRKKRVNVTRLRSNDRNVCPPKNETICFCDASTFHQFGRQLRPEVQMIETHLSTPADATTFVCSFRPTSEVKRVIFWFSNDCAPSHVGLVRLVTVLCQYYTTQYKTIMKYVVVSPSVSSRQDVWTYGIFEYLVQAEVLLLDAQPTMSWHDLLVRDAEERLAIDTEVLTPRHSRRDARLLGSTEDVKLTLREQHQLDLWSYYLADHQPRTAPHDNAEAAPVTVATNLVASETPSTPSYAGAATNAPQPTSTTIVEPETLSTPSYAGAATNLVAPQQQALQPSSTNIVEQNLRVQDVKAQPMLELLLSFQLHQTLRPRPSTTHLPLLLQQPAPIASEDSPTAVAVTVTKAQLHRLMASTPGPRTSSRLPNMDRERNQ